jgi:hypothetical protein
MKKPLNLTIKIIANYIFFLSPKRCLLKWASKDRACQCELSIILDNLISTFTFWQSKIGGRDIFFFQYVGNAHKIRREKMEMNKIICSTKKKE